MGWFADDLVIDCTTSIGKRTAGISIKSDRQVTGAGFPSDFVGIAWSQWLGVKTDRTLRGSNDAIVLMVGSLPNDVEDAWLNLLADALRTLAGWNEVALSERFNVAGGHPGRSRPARNGGPSL